MMIFDGGPINEWVIDRHMDPEKAERRVRQKYPYAYLRRKLSGNFWSYQVRVRTGFLWLSSKALGDTHLFKDQAWLTALNNITKEKK